jgi:hypothetical protein
MMIRKVLPSFVAMAFFMQACSLGVFQPAPTGTPTVSSTPTETGTPTSTATITPSPTIVRLPTQDPNQPTATVVPIPLFVGGNTATPYASPMPVRPGPGFESVNVSQSRLYWGSCKYNRTAISAVVEDPQDVISVVIFVRVKSAEKEDYTPWTTGDVMFNHGNGRFSYLLRGSAIEGHNHYKKSWVFFQLVATDNKGEEVGRTRVYTNAISLEPCMCLDPTTGCPPTPFKP